MAHIDLNKEFSSWKSKYNQHGGKAFSRFVMLKYLDAIQEVSNDFVFKGGNLLWHYIDTPRVTVDLDLSTLTLKSHLEIKKVLVKVEKFYDNIHFSVKKFTEINKDKAIGADIIIDFETTSGQKNQFGMDIVYALPTDIMKVKSTTTNKYYDSASIENIIKDKFSAAWQFQAGNTRMKDFDDLWRLSKAEISVERQRLKDLLGPTLIGKQLDLSWIEYMKDHWSRHTKSYKDLPKDLNIVFSEINEWLTLIMAEDNE